MCTGCKCNEALNATYSRVQIRALCTEAKLHLLVGYLLTWKCQGALHFVIMILLSYSMSQNFKTLTTAVETRAARFATVPEQELQYGYQEFLAVCYEMRKTTISPVCAPSLRDVAR